MKCVHCNGEHPDGFKFCPATGKEIVQSMKACTNPKCVDLGKYILPVDALFCPRCGSRIECSQDNKGSQTVVNTKKKKRNSKIKVSTNRGNSNYSGSYIANTVKEILVEKLGVDRSEVIETASLTVDLGADSLDLVELGMDLEKKFEIDIPDEAVTYIYTVGDIIEYIESKV